MPKFIFNSVFLLFIFAIIITPLFTMDFKSEISQENRRLMARPTFPGIHADSTQLRSFTLNAESWLNDRIGFRGTLTSMYSTFNVNVLQTTPNIQLMLGKDGHTFLASHGAGERFRDSLTKNVLGLPNLDQARVDGLVQQMASLKNTLSVYGVPVALVTIPQKHILDYDKLPFYISHFVTRDTIERPLDVRVAEALPPDSVKFIFPYAEARAENSVDRLYPQKNFHWAPGRYTKLVAAKIAEAFGVAAYEAPGLDEFEKCDIKSDLSQMAGFIMTGQGYLCYRKDVFQRLGIHAVNVAEKYPHLAGLHGGFQHRRNQNKQSAPKILWMGDSFSPFIANELARYFGEVICIDGWVWKGYAASKKLTLKEEVKKLLVIYKPDYVVISRHDIDHLAEHVMDITPQNRPFS